MKCVRVLCHPLRAPPSTRPYKYTVVVDIALVLFLDMTDALMGTEGGAEPKRASPHVITTPAVVATTNPLMKYESRCKQRRSRQVAVDEGRSKKRPAGRVQRSKGSRYVQPTVFKLPAGKHDAATNTVVSVCTSSSQNRVVTLVNTDSGLSSCSREECHT